MADKRDDLVGRSIFEYIETPRGPRPDTVEYFLGLFGAERDWRDLR